MSVSTRVSTNDDREQKDRVCRLVARNPAVMEMKGSVVQGLLFENTGGGYLLDLQSPIPSGPEAGGVFHSEAVLRGEDALRVYDTMPEHLVPAQDAFREVVESQRRQSQ